MSDNHSPLHPSDDGIVFYEQEKQHTYNGRSGLHEEPAYGVRKRPARLAVKLCAFILGVIMLISGTVCIVVYSYISRYNYQSIGGQTEVSNSPQNSRDSSGTNAYSGKLLTDRDILNILLIGADTRYNQVRGNSDTMILMSVDTKHKQLKLLSFMRDTYVSIPGYGENKLTAAYNLGGAALTVQTIESNYGILIDRYAIVDFSSFKEIIDTLGGLDIELTREEVDYIDWQCWRNHQVGTRHEMDADSFSYYLNSEGEEVTKVHLNGRQALWHARNRGADGICSGDDYTRTQRQRNVIGLIVKMLKKSDITSVMNILYAIGPMITTNLKSSEITSLASGITTYLNYEIVSKSAPVYNMIGVDFYYSDEDHPIYIDGYMSSCIVIFDWNDFRNQIADFVFNHYKEESKTTSE